MEHTSISERAGALVSRQSQPWRNAPMATYDPESNPKGIISFAIAENVSRYQTFYSTSI